MLILIRADLFVTLPDRHTHIDWPEELAGILKQACSCPLKQPACVFWGTNNSETERRRDRWADSWWSESGTGGRGTWMGPAQQDWWSLRRPAVGHFHALSVLCNQAACWLECSRTQRNTVADRCPWQSCPRGPEGVFFLPPWYDKRLKQQTLFIHSWGHGMHRKEESC